MSELSKSVRGGSESTPGATGGANGVRLVLASASPRRQDLLRKLLLPFETIASNIEEIIDENLSATEVVISLARQKALDVWNKITEGRKGGDQNKLVVLGSDTLVGLDCKLLGKPKDREDAARALRELSGRGHEVYTGVVILIENDAGHFEELAQAQVSKVYFRKLLDEEIRAYTALEEPMDKAGSYALQGTASAFIERVDGCYSNIVGLPVPLVVSLLRRAGIEVLGSVNGTDG